MTQWERSKQWFRAPDIPFARDDANRFLPWIVAFMVFLTGLMLSVSLSLNTAVHRWNSDYLNSFTVQIPQVDESATISGDEVMALLRDNEWAETVREISRDDMRALIEPWLGKGHGLESLPLPLLIEVKVREGREVDTAALQRRLATLVPGAEIDDYQLWMAKFSRLSAMVQWGAFILAVLIVVTTLGIVVLAAKTALKLHQQTVEVLYTIGAHDDYIAHQFQQNAMRLVLRGAVGGTALAALFFYFSERLSASLQTPLLPAMDFSTGHAILLLALPVLTATAALFSTRYAVLALLKRKP